MIRSILCKPLTVQPGQLVRLYKHGAAVVEGGKIVKYQPFRKP